MPDYSNIYTLPAGALPPKVADEYAERIRDFLDKCDDWGIIELLAELREVDHKVAVWKRLNSTERSFIKQVIAENATDNPAK